MSWVKRHKFWFSVLVIFFTGSILSRNLEPAYSFTLGIIVSQYILFGWLIKVLFFRRKKQIREGK